jgi:hypothetical protein
MWSALIVKLVVRPITRYVLAQIRETHQVRFSNNIPVYSQDEAFFILTDKALSLLSDLDRANFFRVKGFVLGIVDLERPVAWVGQTIGVYFDSQDALGRAKDGPSRLAASLARFAVEQRCFRLLGDGYFKSRRSPIRLRVWKLACAHELRCCEKLECEARHIYALQRQLRAFD